MKVKVFKLECKKCGHTWHPRVSDVIVCPKCHSYKWDTDKNSENAKEENGE